MRTAETWSTIHEAFTQVNFAAYDYDTVKSSLIEYTRINYPENYNNFIENDHFMMVIETLAYVTELLAFRMDMNANENYINNAQRKASILNFATLVAYSPIRNTNVTGLFKIQSIMTSAPVYDSNGFNIAGQTILWNDPNNANWYNQFVAIINNAITTSFGQPNRSLATGITTEIYSLNSTAGNSGIIQFNQNVTDQALSFEFVPADFDTSNNITEQFPDVDNLPSILFVNNSTSSSVNSGFFMYGKQGTLFQQVAEFTNPIINRIFTPDVININNSDVWVSNIDAYGNTITQWNAVNNILYNDTNSTNIYEIETLENDAISLHFGGENYTVPAGLFSIYTRASLNQTLNISADDFTQVIISNKYVDPNGKQQTLVMQLQMQTILSDSISTQSIDDLRTKVLGVYGTNDRMVSNPDYNTWIKQLPGIVEARAVNRTFVGDSLFNDASLEYNQISLTGNDLLTYITADNNFSIANTTQDKIIDNSIQPLLSYNGLTNAITLEQAFYNNSDDTYAKHKRNAQIPVRNQFIENYDITLLTTDGLVHLREKTMIQGYIDQHYYGTSNQTTNKVYINNQLTTSNIPLFIVDGYYDNVGNLINYDRLYDAYKFIAVPTYTFDSDNPTYQTVTSSLDTSISGLQVNTPQLSGVALRYNMFSSKQTTGMISNIVTLSDSDTWITIRVTSINDNSVSLSIINSYDFSTTSIVYVQNTNQEYDQELLTFTLTGLFNLGDTFVFNLQDISSILECNTLGEWVVSDNDFTEVFNPQYTDWHIYLSRVYGEFGKVYWKIYYRNVTTKAYSSSVVLNASNEYTIDLYNQVSMSDYIKLNNIKLYTVNSDINNQVEVIGYNIPNIFSSFININNLEDNLIYTRYLNNKNLLINNINNIPFNSNILDNESTIANYNDYHRYLTLIGAPSIFVYNHFVNSNYIVNPSTTNIIDIFVVTQTYLNEMVNYLYTNNNPPDPQGRIYSYDATINKHKTMSDEVIVRGAELIPVLGIRSQVKNQVQIVVTRSNTTKSSNVIINSIIDLINAMPLMDLGETLYLSTITTNIINNINNIKDVNIIADFNNITADVDQVLVPYITSESIVVY